MAVSTTSSILASILLERPVKWIEDKTGNLISTHYARDVYLDGEMALRRLAEQAHGEVLTQILQAWQSRDASALPTAQTLG